MSPSPVIAGVASVLAPHRYPQEAITEAFGALVTPDPRDRVLLERLHVATGVAARHLVLPLESYAAIDDFGQANGHFINHAVTMGGQALGQALDGVGLGPRDVDLVMTTTVTGVAAPSLDARLVGRVGLRDDVKRVPVFGLGCVAGVAGIARVFDYLVGHPDDVAVLVSVELCSLTVQRADASTANLVASGLFGDGAAAVVMVGAQRAERMGLDRAPRVVSSRSRFFEGTEEVMGWEVGAAGFTVVLAPTVADIVEAHVGDDVKSFLVDHGLDLPDVSHWISHPGGPKVLQALQRALALDEQALAVTWQSLREVGNLSSVSVLHVLERTINEQPPGTGEPAVMLAMGPGFCAEFVLLSW